MTEDPFVTIARALQEHGRPEAPRRVSCFVALGDSFTAGTGSPQGLGWADRIARSLRASHPGFVDEVIEPVETRARLAWALGVLER